MTIAKKATKPRVAGLMYPGDKLTILKRNGMFFIALAGPVRVVGKKVAQK